MTVKQHTLNHPTSWNVHALTSVELTWREKQVEQWIRFGRPALEHTLDPHRRRLGFPPESIFALVRWASNGHGTVLSHIDIVRVVRLIDGYQTLPLVLPGGDILVQARGWQNVAAVLGHIDAIEARGIDPCDVAPDHWRHVHHRIAANLAPRSYPLARHLAWLKRRSAQP